MCARLRGRWRAILRLPQAAAPSLDRGCCVQTRIHGVGQDPRRRGHGVVDYLILRYFAPDKIAGTEVRFKTGDGGRHWLPTRASNDDNQLDTRPCVWANYTRFDSARTARGYGNVCVPKTAFRSRVSWAPQGGGHRYGWAAEPADGQWRCTPKRHRGDQHAFLCATDDGGRHWRRVFDADSSWRGNGPSLLDALRWSPSAGVISVDLSGTSSDSHAEYWTRDGGRHWWLTRVFNANYDSTCNFDVSSIRCTRSVHFQRAGPELRFQARHFIQTPNPDPRMRPTDTTFERTYALEGWVPLVRLSCPRWEGTRRHRICGVADDGMTARETP